MIVSRTSFLFIRIQYRAFSLTESANFCALIIWTKFYQTIRKLFLQRSSLLFYYNCTIIVLVLREFGCLKHKGTSLWTFVLNRGLSRFLCFCHSTLIIAFFSHLSVRFCLGLPHVQRIAEHRAVCLRQPKYSNHLTLNFYDFTLTDP